MTIDTITKHATRIKNGKAKVKPGQAHRISEAASVGDGVWQGDLGLEIISAVPQGYEKREDASPQLVPGTTQGARHCLDSLTGVEVYYHGTWGERYEGLAGPVFSASRDVTVTHPTHGDVTIPEGFIIRCRYQREFDLEQKRERRNRD